jgi:hypothetical protein
MPYADEDEPVPAVDQKVTTQRVYDPTDIMCDYEGYPGHHRYQPTCTHTGPYPSYPICPSAPEVKDAKGNNAPKMPSAEKKDAEDTHKKNVDTMEFRRSDYRFQHFVPRPF